MLTRQIAAVVAACIVATLVAAARVSAQSTEVQPPEVRRPFRGLFAAPAQPGVGQSLDLSASVFGAYDDDVYAAQGAVLSPDVRQTGWFSGLETSLNYARQGRRLGFGADGSLGVTRYPERDLAVMYRTGAHVTALLAQRTSVSVSGAFAYAPEFRLGLFLSPTGSGAFEDPFASVSTDLGVLHEQSYRTNADVLVTQTLSRRSSLSGYYSYLIATYSGENLSYRNKGGGVRYQRTLTRSAGLHLGYSYGLGLYPQSSSVGRRQGIHNIDVGIDYGRALSLSRRTHFDFSTGSALYYAGQETGLDGDRRLRFALLGNAELRHELGRTWTAALAYQRALAFHEGFADPFLAQSLSATLGGLVARRLRSTTAIAFSRGTIGATTNNQYDSSNATAGLQYALTRRLAAYANYVYYRYRFPEGLAVDSRFPPVLARSGVRVGLTTSLPLIRPR